MDFSRLEGEYEEDLLQMKVLRPLDAAASGRRLLLHRDRFLALQRACGVPALWVMPVFEREGPSFDAYLGNGDPLSRPTAHVPRHRGPFDSWELGATDALTLDGITKVPEWSWPRACYEWELYNGFGPRNHGRTSGYLWSGTSVYQGGKYIEDSVWSRGTWDHQLGCVAIARAIAQLDHEIGEGLALPALSMAPGPIEPSSSAPVEALSPPPQT